MMIITNSSNTKKATYFVARTFKYSQTALQFNIQILRIQMVYNVRYHIFRDESNLKVFLHFDFLTQIFSPRAGERKCCYASPFIRARVVYFIYDKYECDENQKFLIKHNQYLMNNTLNGSVYMYIHSTIHLNVNNVVVQSGAIFFDFFRPMLHNIITSDAQFWHVPIMGMMRSMCTLFNNRDINGTKPNFRITSLFGLDSDNE